MAAAAVLARIPSLDPPLGYEGAQGRNGSRPSEKHSEAKDVQKYYGQAQCFGKRWVLPRGMLLGGGSPDYAAVSSISGAGIYYLRNWGTATAAIDESKFALRDSYSLVLGGVPLMGPLDALSYAAGQSPSSLGAYQSGVPISVQAIRRAQGAFVFRQEARVEYKSVTAGQAVTVYVTAEALNAAAKAEWASWTITTDAAPDFDAKFPVSGVIGIVRTVRLSPELNASGSAMSNSIFVSDDVQLSFGTAPGDGASAATAVDVSSATGGSMLHYSQQKTLVLDNETIIWLNMYASNSSVANALYLLDSRGYTMSGHDGIPYDYSQD